MNKLSRNPIALASTLAVTLACITSLCCTSVQTIQARHSNASQAKQEQTKKDDKKADEATAKKDEEKKPALSERDQFIQDWAERIDKFDAGTPLEGYGKTIAEVSYDNNIDPRLPVAIARVESNSGENCAYDYNAWGWGDIVWTDWDSAIRVYIPDLIKIMGSELTYDMAAGYNELDPDGWYAEVASCMEQI